MQILDTLYKLIIIDHREEIEELGGEVLLSKIDGRTLKIVLGIKHPKNGNEEEKPSNNKT